MNLRDGQTARSEAEELIHEAHIREAIVDKQIRANIIARRKRKRGAEDADSAPSATTAAAAATATRTATAAATATGTAMTMLMAMGMGRPRASISTRRSSRVGVRERRFPCQCHCLRELLRLSPWARRLLRLYLRVICTLLGRGESPPVG